VKDPEASWLAQNPGS